MKFLNSLIFLFLFITLLCLDLNAQSGWYWQNPLPQGNDLYDISFVGTSRGWAVGDHGYILHSDDGGLNWTQQNSTTTNELHAVYFINSNTGWAVGIKRIWVVL